MKKYLAPIILFVAFIGIVMPLTLHAQEELNPTFFVGIRYGDQYSGLTRYQDWAFSQNQGPFENVGRNRMIALDMLYQTSKVPFIINAEFDIKESSRAKPYMYSFAFMSGYEVATFPVKISAIGGLGLSFLQVDFGNRTPPDFQSLPYNHSNALARSTLFTARAGLLGSYEVPFTKRFRPIIYGQAIFNQRLMQSRFRYGEYVTGNDGEDYFDGVRVDMPKFFRNSISVSIGLALNLNQL